MLLLCACTSLCTVFLTKATFHAPEPLYLDPHPAVIRSTPCSVIVVHHSCLRRLGSGVSTKCMPAFVVTFSVSFAAFHAQRP